MTRHAYPTSSHTIRLLGLDHSIHAISVATNTSFLIRICLHLVFLQYQVESTEGVGSTFFCTIRFEISDIADGEQNVSLKSQFDNRNQIGALKTEEVQVSSHVPCLSTI